MIIEVDNYKEKIKGYTPSRSELYHRESAHLADKDFEKMLKTNKYKRFIFMAGGTASGKTEFARDRLISKDILVYDGTFKNTTGFNIKFKNIQKFVSKKYSVKVILIIPEDWIKAFEVFLKRERKMDIKTFFETQIKSKISVANILRETKTRVDIYISRPEDGEKKLGYVKLSNKISREKRAKFLENVANSLKNIAKSNGFEI